MNYDQICHKYATWTEAIGAQQESFDLAERKVLHIRDTYETETTLTGEITYAVSVYSGALHLFLYSEETIWRKDGKGNNTDILSVTYTLVTTQ